MGRTTRESLRVAHEVVRVMESGDELQSNPDSGASSEWPLLLLLLLLLCEEKKERNKEKTINPPIQPDINHTTVGISLILLFQNLDEFFSSFLSFLFIYLFIFLAIAIAWK